jgi:hypothetical protein
VFYLLERAGFGCAERDNGNVARFDVIVLFIILIMLDVFLIVGLTVCLHEQGGVGDFIVILVHDRFLFIEAESQCGGRAAWPFAFSSVGKKFFATSSGENRGAFI